jgi:hypothetical protein
MTATPQYGSDLVVDLFRVVGITARGDQSRREGPTLTIFRRAAHEIELVGSTSRPAKVLGLTIPPSLLRRADRVIA